MKKILFTFWIYFFSLSLVVAHPHAWTQLRLVAVNENPANLKINSRDYGDRVVYPQLKLEPNHTAIYGLLFTMELDALSSAPILAEVKRGADDFWAEIATNFVEYNFFTKAKLNGLDEKKAQDLKFAHAISMVDIKVNEHKRVEVIYFAPFAQPVILSDKDYIMLQTYDPSYFIDMSYTSYKSITFSNPNTIPTCEAGLEIASPDASLVDYANSLPIDATPNDPDIGQYFTQTVYLGCPYTP
ncbi:DUF1007 family protein [Psittacicella gerlachiana]|uniref:DUF1007 family protein n=1 Tax=Psittacicella gerlachiana TaxID=2028574 RepID=A0A3A1Y443_9GAMM|nr:DUF1007 family protein [Psittacicella gerlachiana]RIY33092.1 hypothetical protein CKF59_06570 [Psittacicella gerlachiana]